MIETAILLSVLGAIATLGILAYKNRAKVETLSYWAFGFPEENEPGGVHGDIDQVKTQLARIEAKLDQESLERREEHKQAQDRIKQNRFMLVESIHTLVESLDDMHDEDVTIDFPVDPDQDYWDEGSHDD